MVTLALMLLGALFVFPSAVAHSGRGADKAARTVPSERFLAIGTNASTANVLFGFGPIHAKGVDKAVTRHRDVFAFPNGNLIIRRQKTAGHHSHDPVTCLYQFFERGTYKVIRGTGDYVGAHGHGHYRQQEKFVTCTQQIPHTFLILIRAHGALRL
jgi:hypothetical protein